MTAAITVHRGTAEIGGSCIEIRSASGQRLILDAGRPLNAPRDATGLLPSSLDLTGDATVLICHPHQDHWGLINELPARWEVMTGVASAKLIGITARFAQHPLNRELSTWKSRGSFSRGAFRIRPYLTDHSGFDAYMLLIEVDGRRILYSGDFRNHGRKGNLVDQVIVAPPRDVDVLIIEGTNLGTSKPTETEDELEARFVDLARRTAGRVFVTWSGQNIDRTVTLYRAALKAGRTLVVDLYTAEVLEALREHLSAPYLGIDKLKVVLTRSLVSHYRKLGREDWLARMARIGIGAADLERDNYVALIRRGSLHRDYLAKGVTPTADDAYSFSMWSGHGGCRSTCWTGLEAPAAWSSIFIRAAMPHRLHCVPSPRQSRQRRLSLSMVATGTPSRMAFKVSSDFATPRPLRSDTAVWRQAAPALAC